MNKNIYVANAFSLGMLPETTVSIQAKPITLEEARKLLSENEFKSVVGHEGTAIVLSKLLKLHVPFNRQAIKLEEGDTIIVFQLRFRLPEGAVLTQNDLMNILENRLYSLWVVEVKEVQE